LWAVLAGFVLMLAVIRRRSLPATEFPGWVSTWFGHVL